MINYLFVFLPLVFWGFNRTSADFKTEQKKFSRVKNAYEEKEKIMMENLNHHHIAPDKLEILIIAYKDAQVIELWAKNKTDLKFVKIQRYDFCTSSGTLGPKRAYGDGQIPEGFYYINRFNPVSNFHLSLGLNYPNQSDKILSMAKNLGGDIFIHGNCVTIGCMPITDDKIKELYIYAMEAKNNGQNKIPVYIFPINMDNNIMEKMYGTQKNNIELISFWKNIKQGYDLFVQNQTELKISVGADGKYLFE